MRPVEVKIAAVKAYECRRAFWSLSLIIFIIFLFQISVPVVIYSHLCAINDHMPDPKFNYVFTGNNTSYLIANSTTPVFVVSLHKVVDDYLAVLTCWCGAFLFLVAFTLLGCMEMQKLLFKLNHKPTCTHQDLIATMKKMAKFEDIKKVAEFEDMKTDENKNPFEA